MTRQLIVVPDIAEAAAELFVALKLRTLALAGGSTPQRLYERLATCDIAWSDTDVFFGDERCVPPDHPASNFAMASEGLLSKVPARAHRMRGEDCDAAGYERELTGGPVLFASQIFDPEAAAEEARRSGLWANPILAERLWPAEERRVRPLMPLRRGHLALLIAAGFLNNIVLEAAGHRVLVKGRTYKESVPVESDDPDVEIEREVLRTSVVALDIRSGQFEVVQH